MFEKPSRHLVKRDLTRRRRRGQGRVAEGHDKTSGRGGWLVARAAAPASTWTCGLDPQRRDSVPGRRGGVKPEASGRVLVLLAPSPGRPVGFEPPGQFQPVDLTTRTGRVCASCDSAAGAEWGGFGGAATGDGDGSDA